MEKKRVIYTWEIKKKYARKLKKKHEKREWEKGVDIKQNFIIIKNF